jgi:hypothetical protein
VGVLVGVWDRVEWVVCVPDCAGLKLLGRAGEDGGWQVDAGLAAVHYAERDWGEVAVRYELSLRALYMVVVHSYDVL